MRGRFKELLPAVQVIMVTVYEDPDTIFRALRAGASGYVSRERHRIISSTPFAKCNAEAPP